MVNGTWLMVNEGNRFIIKGMDYVWRRLGNILFWLAWPALWLYLRESMRTRILLMAEGKILVVMNWFGDGKWSLPGGGLHTGEEPHAGVLRELHEETGISLLLVDISLRETAEYYDRGLRFTCHYFVAELPDTVTVKIQKPELVDVRLITAHKLSRHMAGADVLQTLAYLDG